MNVSLLNSDFIKTIGNEGLILRKAETRVGKDGLVSGPCVYTCPMEKAHSLAPKKGDIHPLDNRMRVDEAHTVYGPARAVISCTYAGMELGLDETEPVYELIVGNSTEPIEIHSKFTALCGTPSNPNPIAKPIFVDSQGRISRDDKKAMFKHFAATSKYKGQESYVDAMLTFRKRYVSRVHPSTVNGVGKIATPPNQAPSLDNNRNWLYWGLNVQEKAHVYSINEEWKASAEGGWEPDWYTP